MKEFGNAVLKRFCVTGLVSAYLLLSCAIGFAFVVDHTCTDLTRIPENAIVQAKASLHIAYGHTSHGSQLISGMGSSSGAQLDTFLSNSTKYNTTPGLFLWNNGGSGGALDLRDRPFSGANDLGNPNRTAWADATRNYLSMHPQVNVVIWSWCGQASTSIANIDVYLNLMEDLVADYPNVHFVFMTGHLNGGGESGTLHLANEHIRQHCRENNRILYDFADIESYDPDGLVNYNALMATDNCDYDSDGNGSRDKNWAVAWQNTHILGTDWWQSGAAHSQHLNGNLKGYAAWWLWARLGGWSGMADCAAAPSDLTAVENAGLFEMVLDWNDNADGEDGFIVQRQVNNGAWDDEHDILGADVTTYVDSGLAYGSYRYRVVAYMSDNGTGSPCYSAPSNTAAASIVNSEPPAAPSDLEATAEPDNMRIVLNWVDNADNESEFVVQRQVNGEAWEDNYAVVGADITSYTDGTLSGGTYTYRVVARNTHGTSAASNEAGGILPDIPSPPLNLQTLGDSVSGSVSLSWTDNSDNETGFTIQRQVNEEAWQNSYDTLGPNTTSYLDESLYAATYTYRVVAFNPDGNSLPSNESSAVISNNEPVAPTDLSSSQNALNVELNWTDNSDNEESFIVERKTDSGGFAVIDTLGAGTASYTDTNLAPLHTYTYRVKARNNFGDSPYSNETDEYIAEETFTLTLKQGVDGYTGCTDAYLDSQNDNRNYGATPYKYIQMEPRVNLAMAFDLPEQLQNKKIISAKLVVYCWNVSNWETGHYLNLHEISEAWEESTTTWNSWTTPGGTITAEKAAQSPIASGSHYPEFDITDLVQAWVDQTKNNNGVLLTHSPESTVRTGIKASEYSEYGRPCLEVTYTNKEACNANGWRIYDDSPEGARIDCAHDDIKGHEVVEFTGSGTHNGYRLRNEDGSKWHNDTQSVIRWQMRYSENYVVYIDVDTTYGHRYIYYTARDDNRLGDGRYVHHGLGPDSKGGLWRTFVRDLNDDLQDAQPDNEILEVNGFLIRGSGRVHGIQMLDAIPGNLDSDEDGIPDLDEKNTFATDPYKTDTDGDGIEDGEELNYWGPGNWQGDPDTDGLVNLLDPDSDNDGFMDGVEKQSGTDPADSDDYPASITYEDAQDGTVFGWGVYDNTPEGAAITNVFDTETDSRVIQVSGGGTANGYRLRNENGSKWRNTIQFTIEWQMKYSEDYVVYIDVETTGGHRYIYYTAKSTDKLGTGRYVHHGLGAGSKDGTWHTITRDLRSDLHDAQPEVQILEVNGFLIRGNGMVDNIKLLSD